MKRFATFALVILGVTGLKFYNKSSLHDDLQKALVEACPDDKCITHIEDRFESCFENSYTLGRRSQFNEENFNRCISK